MIKLDLIDLIKKEGNNFVSIYMPTHRTSPENKQDKVRFNNLLTEAENILKERGADWESILKAGYELENNIEFWDHTTEGLAVLLSEEENHIYKTVNTQEDRVIVGDRFHVLPLLNYYEVIEDTFILSIAKDNFKLYFGSMEGIKEVELDEVAQTFNELYPDKDNQYYLDGSGAGTLFYRRKDKSEVRDNEREKFFRYVAEALKNFIGENMPLVVFGTTENIAAFDGITSVFNTKANIDVPMYSMTKDETENRLREVLRPKYIENMEKDLDQLRSNIAGDRGTDNLSRIKEDVNLGRIAKLYIGSNFDELDDIKLDELISQVVKNNGEVIYIDSTENDFEEKIGAEYRF